MAELSAVQRYLAVSIALPLCVVTARELDAQSSADSPRRAFEVASVKPTLSPYEAGYAAGRADALGEPAPPAPNYGIQTYPGGRLTAAASLHALIARAWEVEEHEIVDEPDWLEEEYFAIEARVGGDATPAEFNEMLQALLADRFGLRVHRTNRPGQVHSLVLARADGQLGPGLNPTSPECLAEIEARRSSTEPEAPAPAPRLRDGRPDMTPQCGRIRMGGSPSGGMTLSASNRSLSMLVERLTDELDATVVDRTGLEGPLDFVVEYQTQQMGPGPRSGLDPNGTESPKPPLRIAIERQLGLKLESVDGQVPVLVVDAADRPTPN